MPDNTNQKFPEASLPSLASTKKETFENKKIVDWFTKATKPQIDTPLLKRFGLKNPDDLMTFLQSSEGKTVQALINKKIIAMKEREKDAQHNQDDKQKLVSLILGLAYTQEAAADAAATRNIRFNENLVQEQFADAEQRIETKQKQQEEEEETSREALDKESETPYFEASEALAEILTEQEEVLERLGEEIKNIEQAEANQEERANYFEGLINNIESFFDLDSEEKEQLTQNAPKLKVHFDQKIIVNEGGQAYLLNLGQKLDKLTSEEKTNAHNAYKQLEPNLLNDLKKTIKTSYQEEQEQHTKKIDRCFTQCLHLHKEINFVTQQMAALQTTQHQKLKTSPSAEPERNAAIIERSFEQMLRLYPVATIAAQDRLGGPQFLQPTEFGMPIEEQTMRALQENRAGKGANQSANAVSATAEVSHRQHERLHPDAKPNENQAQSALRNALQAHVEPAAKINPPDTNTPLPTDPKPQQ
jgi:hypothetical protein